MTSNHQVLRRALGLTVLLAMVAGCSAEAQRAEDEVTWSGLEETGLAPADQLAVYLSTPVPPVGPERGLLGIIDDEGQARFLPTDPMNGGGTAAGDGVLCASSGTTGYRLDADGAEKWSWGLDNDPNGHWATVRPDGSCVQVFNIGVTGPQGYETDVFWEEDGELRSSVVPDVPGPSGVADGAVWVRNAGSTTTIDSEITLYRTDLATEKTSVAMRWPLFSQTAAEARAEGVDADHRLTFDGGYNTGLFARDDKLYYIEDLNAVDDEGGHDQIEPGFTAELRLAELDPEAEVYRSTFLGLSPAGMTDTAEGHVSLTAIAMRGGHLYDDALYSGDAEGNIVAVDLEQKRLRTVGTLSDDARKAKDVLAAWSGPVLALLIFTRDDDVLLERYDLRDGSLTSTQSVDGFDGLLEDYLTFDAALLN